MKTYHCSEPSNWAKAICNNVQEDDIVVPYAEIHADGNRHFNCPDCAEALAKVAGGLLKRKQVVDD